MGSFKETIEWIDDNFPYMVTPIANLGTPQTSPDVVTAAVSFDRYGAVQLSVHEPFFEKNNDAENTGVLFHELNHISLGHLDEFDKFENEQARIIAQECIVNDTVIQEGAELPDCGLYFGQDWVGYDCAYLPTRVVYDDLMKNPEKLPQQVTVTCGHEHNGEQQQSGSGMPGTGQAIKQIFKNADLTDASEGQKESISNTVSKAGTDFDIGKLLGKSRISLAWPTLINKIHPKTFDMSGRGKNKSTWATQRRNLMGMRKRIMLPASEPSEREGMGNGKRKLLIMALDTSGSVPFEKQEELLSLAKSVPSSKLEVKVCTFSTQHVPFDISKGTDQTIAQGGTDFSAVREFISTLNLTQKPKVIVITDGDADFRDGAPDDLDANWHWLIFGRDEPRTYDPAITQNLMKYEEFIK